MATRKKKKWTRDSQGEYSRQIGWKPNQEGRYVQHKFRLGSDLASAQERAQRLQAFWNRIEETKLGPERAVWHPFTLEIAKQIAKGQTEVVVQRLPKDANEAYARYLHRIQRHYPMLHIVADDEQAFLNGKRQNQERVEAELDKVRKSHLKSGNLPEIEVASCKSASLHEAFDAYISQVKRATIDVPQPKPSGTTRLKNAERLKERHADTALVTIRFDQIQVMIDYWKNRPLVKRRGTPIRRKTAIHHISELIRFFRWLHRTEDFEWRKPDDFDELDRRVPETKTEIQARETPAQVKTYSREQLCTLYEYATPLERVIMLLALNCGFGAAELGTLLLRQIVQGHFHPMAAEYDFDSKPTDWFVKRIRLKNRVYGEHLLWQHTVMGLKWALDRRQAQGSAEPSSLLFVTDKGAPFFKATAGKNEGQRFANIWGGLTNRVRKDYPEFEKLSFGKLRKTGGNLIRRFADGEVAGVFLCHGKPVKSDDLSGVYTNPTFGKVFKASKVVEEYLAPMFAVTDDPFGKYHQQYLSRKLVKRIVELFDQGTTVARIATEVGVAPSTIYRHLELSGRQAKRQKSVEVGTP
jgi:hypothetical protein